MRLCSIASGSSGNCIYVGGHIQVFDHGRIVENGRYGRVIYALITNMEAVRENYGNSECNN